MPADEASGGAVRPRRVARPTEERLWRRALFYLERFATTRAHLHEVLRRRALREARALDLDAREIETRVARVVARAVEAGLVDDAAFALARARRLLERGVSPRSLRVRLRDKGVPAETIERALEELADEMGDPSHEAARAFARRRRIGPYRPPEERDAMRQRDLAAFARAGFSYHVARAILDEDRRESHGDGRNRFGVASSDHRSR